MEPRTAETKTFRMELEYRGQTLAQFCQRAGLSFRYIQHQMLLNFPSPRVQAMLEAALGYKPVWSKPSTVALRKQIRDSGRTDPGLLQRKELSAVACSLGLPIRENKRQVNWPQLLESVLAKMSVNSTSQEHV